MKKSAIVSFVALALFLGTAFQAAAQSTKIGTVDMKEVFQRYWRTKEAETKMNDIRATVKRDLDERAEKRKSLETEITKLNDDIKKPEVSAAKKEAANRDREKKIAEWQGMMKDLQSFTQEKDKALSDQTMRIRNGIVDEITKVVKDEVKSEQFDLVFDVSGHSVNNVPVVMYAAEKYDFTDKVITKLNADAPKGAAATEKPADKPADKPAEKPADKPAEKKK
jgi:outer membrane protein